MLRTIRWVSCALIAILAVAWAAGWVANRDPSGVLAAVGLSPTPSMGGPFTLVGTDGRRVTDADFRGKWMVIYFGYAYCPDVCPTELQTISSALDLLGPAAASIVPLFITTDPERDTPVALGQYVKLFDDRLIGLTGSTDEIAHAERSYRVYAARVAGRTPQTYVIDHSSLIYFVAPDGQFRVILPSGSNPDELANAIRSEIAKNG
jgi:cytochrome oxidase Cu insertion factor (SCO1/SenC/PrrC family)